MRAYSTARPTAVAVGIQGVSQGNKAYVANIVSGQVSVVNLNTNQHVKDIPVTLTPDCRRGAAFNVFHTLQVPIQLPVSPDDMACCRRLSGTRACRALEPGTNTTWPAVPRPLRRVPHRPAAGTR